MENFPEEISGTLAIPSGDRIYFMFDSDEDQLPIYEKCRQIFHLGRCAGRVFYRNDPENAHG